MPKMKVSFFLGGWRTGWCEVTPMNSFVFLGVLTFVPILVKIDQKYHRESACRLTDIQTDR